MSSSPQHLPSFINMSRLSSARSLDLIVSNTIANRGVLAEATPLASLPRCPGRPALVIGAGPSANLLNGLDEDLIGDLQRRFLVLCSASMLSTCLHAGLRPDIVCACDPDAVVYGPLHDWTAGEDISDIPLATTPDVHPSVLNTWRSRGGTLIGMLHRVEGHNFKSEIQPLIYPQLRTSAFTALGCVANQAAVIARFLSCEPIVLLGVDFGFPIGRSRSDIWKKQADLQADGSASGAPRATWTFQPAPPLRLPQTRSLRRIDSGFWTTDEQLSYKMGLLVAAYMDHPMYLLSASDGILNDTIPEVPHLFSPIPSWPQPAERRLIRSRLLEMGVYVRDLGAGNINIRFDAPGVDPAAQLRNLEASIGALKLQADHLLESTRAATREQEGETPA